MSTPESLARKAANKAAKKMGSNLPVTKFPNVKVRSDKPNLTVKGNSNPAPFIVTRPGSQMNPIKPANQPKLPSTVGKDIAPGIGWARTQITTPALPNSVKKTYTPKSMADTLKKMLLEQRKRKFFRTPRDNKGI